MAALNFTDNFTGTTIDTAKWNETDTGTNVNQDDQLELKSNNAFDTNGVVSDNAVDGLSAVMEFSITTPATLSGSEYLIAGFAKDSSLNWNAQCLELYIYSGGANNISVLHTLGTLVTTTYNVAVSTTYDVKIVWNQQSQEIYMKGGSFGTEYVRIFDRHATVNPNGAYVQLQAYSSGVTYIIDDFSVTQEKVYPIPDDRAEYTKTETGSGNVTNNVNSWWDITGNGNWDENGVVSNARTDSDINVLEVQITTPSSFDTNDDILFGFDRNNKLKTGIDVSRFMVFIDASEANKIWVRDRTTDNATGETLATSTTYTFKLLWSYKTVSLYISGGAWGATDTLIYNDDTYDYVPRLMYVHFNSKATSRYDIDDVYVGKKTSTALTDYTNGIHRWKMNESSWSSPGDVIDSIGTADSNPIGNADTVLRQGYNSTYEAFLDGNGDYIDCQNDTDSFPSIGAISFFVRLSSSWGANDEIFANKAGGGGVTKLISFQWVTGDKQTFFTASDAGTDVDGTPGNTVYTRDKEYFITLTWDVSTKHKAIYVNGELDVSDTIVGTMGFPTNFDDFHIGQGRIAPSWDLPGRIRDFTIWGTAELTVPEMNAIMADDGGDFPRRTRHGSLIGDSIAVGNQGGGNGVDDWLVATGEFPINNRGVGGETTTEIESRFVSQAVADDAANIYIIASTNDYYFDPNIPIVTTKANFLTMLGHCEKEGMQFLINETPPLENRSGGSAPPSGLSKEEMQEWTKKLGAMIKEICVEYGIMFGAAYQDMCENDTTQEDDLLLAFQADEIHPNASGREVIADYFRISAVPLRQIRWGHTNYPAVNEESWRWWTQASGTGSITGDSDTGTASLDSGEFLVSDVKCITDGVNGEQITLFATESSGTVKIYYRTSSSNFDRDDAAAWTEYTSPFSVSDQFNFIQIKIEHLTGTPATVSDFTMSWGTVAVSMGIVGTLLNGGLLGGRLINKLIN